MSEKITNAERLARIEERQEIQSKQLDKMVESLQTLTKIELQNNEQNKRFDVLEKRVEIHTRENQKWAAFRQVAYWALSLVVAIAVGVAVKVFT